MLQKFQWDGVTSQSIESGVTKTTFQKLAENVKYSNWRRNLSFGLDTVVEWTDKSDVYMECEFFVSGGQNNIKPGSATIKTSGDAVTAGELFVLMGGALRLTMNKLGLLTPGLNLNGYKPKDCQNRGHQREGFPSIYFDMPNNNAQMTKHDMIISVHPIMGSENKSIVGMEVRSEYASATTVADAPVDGRRLKTRSESIGSEIECIQSGTASPVYACSSNGSEHVGFMYASIDHNSLLGAPSKLRSYGCLAKRRVPEHDAKCYSNKATPVSSDPSRVLHDGYQGFGSASEVWTASNAQDVAATNDSFAIDHNVQFGISTATVEYATIVCDNERNFTYKYRPRRELDEEHSVWYPTSAMKADPVTCILGIVANVASSRELQITMKIANATSVSLVSYDESQLPVDWNRDFALVSEAPESLEYNSTLGVFRLGTTLAGTRKQVALRFTYQFSPHATTSSDCTASMLIAQPCIADRTNNFECVTAQGIRCKAHAVGAALVMGCAEDEYCVSQKTYDNLKDNTLIKVLSTRLQVDEEQSGTGSVRYNLTSFEMDASFTLTKLLKYDQRHVSAFIVFFGGSCKQAWRIEADAESIPQTLRLLISTKSYYLGSPYFSEEALETAYLSPESL